MVKEWVFHCSISSKEKDEDEDEAESEKGWSGVDEYPQVPIN
jgi:hypothetical protein